MARLWHQAVILHFIHIKCCLDITLIPDVHQVNSKAYIEFLKPRRMRLLFPYEARTGMNNCTQIGEICTSERAAASWFRTGFQRCRDTDSEDK